MDTKPLQRLFRPEDGGHDEDDLKLLFETSGGEGGIRTLGTGVSP